MKQNPKSAGMPQSADVRDYIDKSVPFTCKEEIAGEICNNDMFMQAIKLRVVSKLLTGGAEDAMIPIQVFMCTRCGTVPPEFDIQ